MNGSYVLFDSGSGTYYTSQDPLETNTAKLNLLYDAGGNHFQWLAYGNGTYVGMARAYNQGCATAYVSNAQDTPGKPFPIDIAVYPVITIYGKAGYSYDIQFSIWPNGPWQTMTNIQITSDTYLWIDHTYPYPRKYYRAVLSP